MRYFLNANSPRAEGRPGTAGARLEARTASQCSAFLPGLCVFPPRGCRKIEDKAGLFADIRLSAEWDRFEERANLSALIDHNLCSC
jgi:hypothetical protein